MFQTADVSADPNLDDLLAELESSGPDHNPHVFEAPRSMPKVKPQNRLKTDVGDSMIANGSAERKLAAALERRVMGHKIIEDHPPGEHPSTPDPRKRKDQNSTKDDPVLRPTNPFSVQSHEWKKQTPEVIEKRKLLVRKEKEIAIGTV